MKILIIVILILVILLTAATCFFFTMTLKATKTRKEDVLSPLMCLDKKEEGNEIQNRFIDTRTRIRAEGAEFDRTMNPTQIVNKSGLKLYGRFKLQEETTHKWIISVHGYRDDHRFMLPYVMGFYKAGFNVFTQDNRAHGLSDGDYISMGWHDKDDVYEWIDCIRRMDPEAQVIVHGVSMGGATTMMVSGLNHPAVVGYIEDCGYTTTWEMFKVVMNRDYHLPTFPIMNLTNLVSIIKLKYNFKTSSSLAQIAKCKCPIMFIHGEKDPFIPVDMCHTLYNSFQGEKDLYIAPNAGHAESMDYDPDEYFKRCVAFIDRIFALM
ncbi:MAG: alpha/beta hydrolase [Lachnospiraceae bacterium]|nr:alpha/beta hydrolase [Lachnospiraceae bacterium]